MKSKKKFLTFWIVVILIWNLSDSVLQVYGSASQSYLEQEDIRGFEASVKVQDKKEALKAKDKVVLNIHAENKTEKNEFLRLNFCETEENLPENKKQWGGYLKNGSHQIRIEEFQESNHWEVPVKSLKQGESGGELKEYKESEAEEGGYYAELELPAGTYTDFSLTITSEKAARIAVIPTFGKENFVYGEAAAICWKEIDMDANREETQGEVQGQEELQEGTQEGVSKEDSESIKIVPETSEFRTSVPQKGGVLNIQYGFDEAQWTTIYPKEKGYATADIVPGGELIHTVFVADSGYEIKSGRLLSEDGIEIERLDDCVGKERYEYDVNLLRETMTLEVVFAQKGVLTDEQVIYQDTLDFIYHRDSCAQVLKDLVGYRVKRKSVGMPDAVKLEVGEKILYPSQFYHTREFYISGCDGIVGIGYCMQPNKKNPSSGWYYDIKSLDEARPDYANAYKLAMLTNYEMELQELGDNWFGELDQGKKTYREIYIHAVIGYLETGSLLGLVGTEQGKIIKIANEVYEKANHGEVADILKNYRIYAINGGTSRYQDICFIIRNAKGGLSIQKESTDLDLTENNPNYSLAGAVYGIYTDVSCTNEIANITTNEQGYGTTGDDMLEGGIYYVKEKVPSPGYLLDETIYTYEVTEGIAAQENQKISKEPPKSGKIKVEKTSAVLDITNGNACYNLKGAEYSVYTNQECTENVTKIVLDTNGKGISDTIPLGEYYIKETKSPEGYEMDEQVYKVFLGEENSEVTIAVVKVQDYPGYDKLGIRLTKMGYSENISEMPTLEGTQFTIKYYDGYYSKESLPKTAKREWVIEIKKEEEQYVAQLRDSYLVEPLSDDLYKGADGETILPYGTIAIQETKPAAGYTLKGNLKDEEGNIVAKDGEIFVSQVNKKDGTVKLEGGNHYKAEDMPIEGSIKLKKFDADGITPLKGAIFEIKNGRGEILHTAEANENGEILFENLKPDIYTITEKKTVQGNMLLKEPLVVQVPIRVTEEQIESRNIDKSQCVYDPVEKMYYIYHFVYEITNHANFKLPMTGGRTTPGTVFPMVVGVILLAGTIEFARRKREKF